MNKAERIHKILNRKNGYFLFIKNVTGETIGSGVDDFERQTYIAHFNKHNQIDELDEKTKQECINRIRTNGKRIDNLQYDYLNLSMIQGWFFNLKEIMSFQELGETEYLRQINEAEYIRLRREIDKLTVEQTKYKNLDPEYKSIGTKIEEFNQRRSQFTDWFMAKNLGIPNYSSEIKDTAKGTQAKSENQKLSKKERLVQVANIYLDCIHKTGKSNPTQDELAEFSEGKIKQTTWSRYQGTQEFWEAVNNLISDRYEISAHAQKIVGDKIKKVGGKQKFKTSKTLSLTDETVQKTIDKNKVIEDKTDEQMDADTLKSMDRDALFKEIQDQYNFKPEKLREFEQYDDDQLRGFLLA